MVSGDLKVFPLLPVLQMLLASGRSGLLSLQHERGGFMWFENGELVHASSSGLTGEAALQLLSIVESGTFTFEGNQEAPEKTIRLRQDIIMRRMLMHTDLWQPFLQTFDDWNSTLRFTSVWSEDQALTRVQYQVASQVGKGSIVQMMQATPLAPLDFFENLQQLLDKNWIGFA